MSRRKNINLTVQPLDNLRLVVQVRDEKLADLLRVFRRVRRAIQWVRQGRRPK